MYTNTPESKWSGKLYIGSYIRHAEEKKKGKGEP